ncbi:MAG: peptide chain release factor aRF-1 [Candidatus Pacearchaeota archaeon]|nr:peptide chain release factor aRF-1 [Candidatus Pacearchaeota archaeon]
MEIVQELTQKQKQELEELVTKLEKIKGRHTELVSVMIPAGFNLPTVVRQLEAERSTAENIKSKATRTAVIDSLDMIIRELKKLKQTPKNGLAAFAGNVSEKEGVQDIQIWLYEPPKPLNVRLYRCDQKFIIEPLKEMLEVSEIYGLVVMDRQEATIGLLEGKQIKVLRSLTSGVPSKIRAGGQSSQRFHRITEGLAKEFFRRIAEAMKEIFFDMSKLKGILIGGPVPTKDEFLEQGELVTKLKEKIIAIKDIGYADEHGLKLLVEASQDEISQQELIKEKNIVNKFFETIGKNKEKATYGEEKVKLALERGAVSIILISKKMSKEKIEEFSKLAENIGAEVYVITTESPEGEQFLNLTKGIGAILRFQIE